MADVRPVVIGFDGSAAAEHAIRETGPLLAGQRALVVVVWKAGLGFELATLPTSTIGLPPAEVDVRTALEIDREIEDRARRLAQRGAGLARDAGFAAEGLAVAESPETPVAEAILDVARGRKARALVIGADDILGGTSRDVIRHAPCPVVVTRNRED